MIKIFVLGIYYEDVFRINTLGRENRVCLWQFITLL